MAAKKKQEPATKKQAAAKKKAAASAARAGPRKNVAGFVEEAERVLAAWAENGYEAADDAAQDADELLHELQASGETELLKRLQAMSDEACAMLK